MKIVDAITSIRLSAFRDMGDKNDQKALINYRSNIELSEALYPTLHILEVIVRNHLVEQINILKGPDWLINNRSWLGSIQIDMINKAEWKLRRAGKLVTSGGLVAELTLGFWASLTSNYYRHPIYGIWPNIPVKGVFPYSPTLQNKVTKISHELQRIKNLRNRVFHFESITTVKDLDYLYSATTDLIAWVSPEVTAYLKAFDRFPQTFTDFSKIPPRKFKW